jgi:hypothetical protein
VEDFLYFAKCRSLACDRRSPDQRDSTGKIPMVTEGAAVVAKYEYDPCPTSLHWNKYEDDPVQLAPTFRAFLEKLSNA